MRLVNEEGQQRGRAMGMKDGRRGSLLCEERWKKREKQEYLYPKLCQDFLVLLRAVGIVVAIVGGSYYDWYCGQMLLWADAIASTCY